MTSIQQKGLPSERVHGTLSVNVDYLECCICRDLLWKPIACQTCETPFCSSCINQWLMNNPSKCPNRCETFIERKCPPFIAKLLAQLQITCFYQSNGCNEIMSYEALDKHEINCGYQFKQCSGCQSKILKKDFSIHKNTCELFKFICKDCKLRYKRDEAHIKHTENICLKKQIKQLKYESNENRQEIEKLNSILNEMFKLFSLTQRVIAFDDLPTNINNWQPISRYQGLKWTNISYVHELFIIRKYPKSGYATSFMPGGSLHVAFFGEEASISTETLNQKFNVISLSAAAAWNDDLQLTITGYRDSIEVNHYNIVLFFGRPQRIYLQWKNIDKIVLKPFGGTPHPGAGSLLGGTYAILNQLIIDDMAEAKNN